MWWGGDPHIKNTRIRSEGSRFCLLVLAKVFASEAEVLKVLLRLRLQLPHCGLAREREHHRVAAHEAHRNHPKRFRPSTSRLKAAK